MRAPAMRMSETGRGALALVSPHGKCRANRGVLVSSTTYQRVRKAYCKVRNAGQRRHRGKHTMCQGHLSRGFRSRADGWRKMRTAGVHGAAAAVAGLRFPRRPRISGRPPSCCCGRANRPDPPRCVAHKPRRERPLFVVVFLLPRLARATRIFRPPKCPRMQLTKGLRRRCEGDTTQLRANERTPASKKSSVRACCAHN